jgi:hypothetical protein
MVVQVETGNYAVSLRALPRSLTMGGVVDDRNCHIPPYLTNVPR